MKNDDVERHIQVAIMAIDAAMRAVAVFATHQGMTDGGRDMLAKSLVINAVQLVGARRSKELADEAAQAGAGSSFS